MNNVKKKAKELFDKMYQYQWRSDTIEFRNAKQCALIAVDVILIDCGAKDWSGDEACEGKNYWQEVKKK